MVAPEPTAGDGVHRSYASLMGDPAKDPCVAGGEGDPLAGYSSIFHRWRVSGDAVPTVGQVHRDLITDFDAPVGAVGYFVTSSSSPTGILKITHGYRAFVGLPTTVTNRGQTFGYVGDVVGGLDINTFALDPDQLGRTDETRCAETPERHLELLQAEPGAAALGPFEDEAIPAQVTVTRKAMFIPFGLVEYVLDKDLSAREAFEILWPVIESKGWQEPMKPLVNFLMVASTLHATGAPTRTVHTVLGKGATSEADVLHERRERVLYQQLPALRPPYQQPGAAQGAAMGAGAGLDPFMASLVAQVAQMNDHARVDREDRRIHREQAALPKTVRERFQDYTTDKLLALLTDGLEDMDLPRLYQELAGRQKGVSKRMILQHAYDLAAKELKLNRLPASPSHVLDLDQWDYVGPSMDAIGTGLLPFSIVPPDAPSKQARQALRDDAERSRQYDMSGEAVAGAISAADAKKLYNAKGYIPCEWAEADIQLELYGVMLGALLGCRHAVTRNRVAAYLYYVHLRTRLQASMNRKFGTNLAPALLVFHFQLHYRSWFQERFIYESVDNPDPDVVTGLQQFSRSNTLAWLPGYEDVPCLVALEPNHAAGHAVGQPAPLAVPAPLGRTTGGSAGPSRPRGAAPGPSGAPAGASAPPPPGATPPTPAPTRVVNTHRDARLTGSGPLAGNVLRRTIHAAIEAAGGPPPSVVRAGTTMAPCLSWHLKGTCYVDCNRRADHVANTEEEKEALWGWTQSAFS